MYQFKQRWMNDMYEKLKLQHPEDSDEDIIKFLNKIWDKNFTDPEVVLYNNYDKTEMKTTLSKTIEIIDQNKFITTESGTVFRHHEDCFNPDTKILDKKLAERKIYKKEKFKYAMLADKEKDPEKKKYYEMMSRKKDLAQLRRKTSANSKYGVSGLPSSWFFNMACASATTARGQALISTAMCAFEDFLRDNVKFMVMDECVDFINNIVKEQKTLDDSEWVEDITDDELSERLRLKFLDTSNFNNDIISKIIPNLTQKDKNRIFYKCNLYEFLKRSKRASKLICGIALTNVIYTDPMSPPKEIKKKLEKFTNAMLEYVHYNYPTVNRTYRLKHHKRKTVRVIDTDSNIVDLEAFVNFVLGMLEDKYHVVKRKDVINGICFVNSRKKKNKKLKEQEELVYRIMYSIVHCITIMIDRVLYVFQERCNMIPNSHGTINMKNEFLYLTLLTTASKKHYCGAIKVQEGNVYENPKIDFKGVEFKKRSRGGDATRSFIEDIVTNDILLAENHNPNLGVILDKLERFEQSIEKSVMNGEDKYIKSVSIKSPDAYDDPMRIGYYKAAFVWNHIYPDNAIELPGRGYVMKVNMLKLKDIEPLQEEHPKIYEKLKYLYENEPHIKKSGINSIAIPIDTKIPNWLKTYINLDEIKSNNVKLILDILNSLGLKTIYRTKSSKFFSNIINL